MRSRSRRGSPVTCRRPVSPRPLRLSAASRSTSKSFNLSRVSQPRVIVLTKCRRSISDVDSSKWQILYLAKLKACHKIADFSDVKKDVELKETKKECLIEIIDVLDEPEAADTVFKERVLEAAMQMISANLFRTFANKST